jgi:hypothetical protein
VAVKHASMGRGDQEHDHIGAWIVSELRLMYFWELVVACRRRDLTSRGRMLMKLRLTASRTMLSLPAFAPRFLPPLVACDSMHRERRAPRLRLGLGRQLVLLVGVVLGGGGKVDRAHPRLWLPGRRRLVLFVVVDGAGRNGDMVLMMM